MEWDTEKVSIEAAFPSLKSSLMRILMAIEELTRAEWVQGDEVESYTFGTFPIENPSGRQAMIRRIWIDAKDSDLHVEYGSTTEGGYLSSAGKGMKSVSSTLKEAEEHFPGLARAIHEGLTRDLLREKWWSNEEISILWKAIELSPPQHNPNPNQ